MAKSKKSERVGTLLKGGDTVMVIAGGHKTKRPNKGQTGVLKRFVGKKKDRVIVEGLNMVTKNQRATQPGQPSGKIQQEAGIHISNVMYYAEKAKQPVRLKHSFLEDGRKVRGYTDPKTNEFVQIDA